MPAPHDYFEHGADIGVIGRGASVEEALAQAAVAMFAIMTELQSVQPAIEVVVDFDEDDVFIMTRALRQLPMRAAHARPA